MISLLLWIIDHIVFFVYRYSTSLGLGFSASNQWSASGLFRSLSIQLPVTTLSIYLSAFLTVFIISNRFFCVFLVWTASVYVLPRQWETGWAETRSSKRSPQSRRMIALCSILACVWNLHCFFPFSDSCPCCLNKKSIFYFCLYFLYVNLCLFKKSKSLASYYFNFFFFFAFMLFLHYNMRQLAQYI